MKKPHHGDKKWNKEAGSTLARVSRKVTGHSEEQVPTMTAEQHRQQKMEESKLERERLNKLLSEDHQRIAEERRKQP